MCVCVYICVITLIQFFCRLDQCACQRLHVKIMKCVKILTKVILVTSAAVEKVSMEINANFTQVSD